jgi:hypothetical protein
LLIYKKEKMSLIFHDYKFNENYYHNDPYNLFYFKQSNNNEKQKRNLLENSYNGNLNANINYSLKVNKINNNEFSNPNSPLIKKNNNNNYKNFFFNNINENK